MKKAMPVFVIFCITGPLLPSYVACQETIRDFRTKECTSNCVVIDKSIELENGLFYTLYLTENATFFNVCVTRRLHALKNVHVAKGSIGQCIVDGDAFFEKVFITELYVLGSLNIHNSLIDTVIFKGKHIVLENTDVLGDIIIAPVALFSDQKVTIELRNSHIKGALISNASLGFILKKDELSTIDGTIVVS